MSNVPLTVPDQPDYVWEIATLFPEQGYWSDEEYLDLTDHSNRRIEFTDGRLEFLPMPTEVHEALVQFMFLALYQFVVRSKCGQVYSNGIRVRTGPRHFRLPDVLFLHKNHFGLRHNRVWEGADLVMEVVSDDPKDRARDYEQKWSDYANANVGEYWIVDPKDRRVIVHRLEGGRYAVHGEFAEGHQATSVVLPGFGIDVSKLFAVIEDIPD